MPIGARGTAETDQMSLPDGRTLSWRSTGPVDGPVVLWLHSSTGSARTAPVADSARVLSYDRPGYAASSEHPGRDLLTDVADTAALLDHLGIEEVTVLAFSGGAAVAFAVAGRLGPRVRRLGIVSGVTWPTEGAPPLPVLHAAAAALRADPAGAVERLTAGAAPRDRTVLADPALRQQLLDGAVDAVAAGTEGWVREAHLLRSPWTVQPADVQVPVTWWHGEQDDVVPLAAAEEAASALPRADLHRLPDAGHLGWMTDRERILQGLLNA
jgi:pimeloyl-ACP methyl ester carboxylesterase